MEWWQAIILGLVEGITEYLPVSSTGHLIIASALLGLDTPELKSSVDSFNIVVQGGAILAVLGLYRTRVLMMIRGVLGKDPAGLRLFLLLMTAFMPAAVLGLLLDSYISSMLFYTGPVLAALLLGGVWMIWLDRARLKKHRVAAVDGSEPDLGPELHELAFKQAIAIGFLQCLAMWPGTSRSMMTIAGGVLVGLKPARAAEFSFLLGLPTLGGACVYKLYSNLAEAREQGTPNLFEVIGVAPIVIATVVATGSAMIAVKWLIGFLNSRGLEPFGWYRIVLALVLAGLAGAGIVSIGPDEGPADEAGVQTQTTTDETGSELP